MSRPLALALILAFAGAATALADGFMTSGGPIRVTVRSGQMVRSPRQEALLVFDGETVEVVLRTHFRAGPEDVAWIIPVPAKPENVAALDKDKDVFAGLDDETAPRFRWTETPPKRPHAGGGEFGALSEGGDGHVEKRVVVEASGNAGPFEWTALGAGDAATLIEWLQKNGYAVPDGAERVADRYVKDRWHWLAVRIRPGAAAAKTLAPQPIVYRYKADKLVYPLVISKLSADAENEVLLYVLAKTRVGPANWHSGRISGDEIRRDHKSPSGTNYEAVFADLTHRNQGHFLVTEFAADLLTAPGQTDVSELDLERLNKIFGAPLAPVEKVPPLSGLCGILENASPLARTAKVTYLTRLRAIMRPGAMDRDIALKPLERSWTVRSVYNFASGYIPVEALGEPLASANP